MAMKWGKVRIDSITRHAEPLSYLDMQVVTKMASSISKWGQLRPVLLRDHASGIELLDGRSIVMALTSLGVEEVFAVNFGDMSDEDALKVRLSVRLRMRTDYASLGSQVARAIDAGQQPDQIAQLSPFTSERLQHFSVLSKFDWSQFKPDTSGQSVMDWESEGEGDTGSLF